MTRIVLEPEIESRLSGFQEAVEVCNHDGRLIGYFHPVRSLRDLSPLSDEEVKNLRGQSGSRPLQDILKDLQAS
ncbi:MAG: hypothetical protein ACKV2Q_19050 [Planctomycetaceae bacterium]